MSFATRMHRTVLGAAAAAAGPLSAGLKNGLTDWYSLDGDYTSQINAAHNGARESGLGFEFTNSSNGFGGNMTNLGLGPNSLTLTATAGDPYIYNGALPQAFNGGVYRYLHIRIKRLAGTGWDGGVFFTTGAVGGTAWTGAQMALSSDPTAGVADGQFHAYVVDMWAAAAGATIWQSNPIGGLRFDFGNNAGDNFELDSIYVSTSPTVPYPVATFFEASPRGQRAIFAGGDWIHVPDAVGQNGTQTFACWATGTGPIYSKGSDASGSNGWGVLLSDDATNVGLTLITTVPGATGYSINLPHGATDMSIPRFYVWTFNSPGNLMAMSVNGGPMTTKTTGSILRGADNVYFGVSHSSAGPFGAGRVGTIEEVGMWNRVLTTAEIAELYNGGAGRTYS